jgi:hypothetical protein
MAWLAWRSRDDLLRVLSAASPFGIAIAILSGIALNIVYGLQFDVLLAKHGHGHDRRRRVAAYLLSQPGKYVPGKLWSVLLQSFALGRDARLATITIANVELTAIAMVQTVGLGLACLRSHSPVVVVAALAGASLATIAIARIPSTRLLARLAPRLQRWLKLPIEAEPDRSDSRAMLSMLAVAALACNIAASWWLLSAVRPAVDTAQLFPLLASLYLGFAASLLAVPVPVGLGVREAAVAGLGSIIAPDMAATLIVSVVLLIRCWQLVVDILSLALGWLLLRSAVRNEPPQE